MRSRSGSAEKCIASILGREIPTNRYMDKRSSDILLISKSSLVCVIASGGVFEYAKRRVRSARSVPDEETGRRCTIRG